MSDKDTKQCPFCAETIKRKAKICRFCHMNLATGIVLPIGNSNAVASTPNEIQAKSGVEDGVKLGCGMFIVLPILLFVGFMYLLCIINIF